MAKALACILVLLSCAFARAQTSNAVCGLASTVLRDLEIKYNETVKFRGFDPYGRSIVVTMDHRGNWTVLGIRVDADGKLRACMLNSGKGGLLIPGEKS